jgi:hypothetical protein
MNDLADRLRRTAEHLPVPPDPFERLLRRRDRKRRGDRIAAAVVAGLVALVVFGGGVVLLRGIGADGRSGPASGDVLGGSLGLEPGQYFYLKGTTLGGGDGARIDQETWWAPDGSGELRFDTDRPDKYIPWPPEGVYGEGEFPVGVDGIFEDVESLSHDPVVLEEQLRERGEGGEPTQLWQAIVDLLYFERSPNVLPELRAALFEVAAGLDGVTRDDDAEDPVGRDAISLAFIELTPTERYDWVLFFDPESHQLMAEKVSWDGKWDGIGDSLTIVESAIVDSPGAEPSEDQLLFPPPEREPEPPVPPSPEYP